MEAALEAIPASRWILSDPSCRESDVRTSRDSVIPYGLPLWANNDRLGLVLYWLFTNLMQIFGFKKQFLYIFSLLTLWVAILASYAAQADYERSLILALLSQTLGDRNICFALSLMFDYCIALYEKCSQMCSFNGFNNTFHSVVVLRTSL